MTYADWDINVTGQTGPTGPAGAVPEAPKDGQIYARQGSTASWQPAQAPITPVQNRNRFINGHFIVDQYHNFVPVTPVALGANYVCDRWNANITQPNKLTFAAVPPGNQILPGAAGCMSIQTASAYTSAAADVFQFGQKIEFNDIRDLGFGYPNPSTITLSFWAFATIGGTYSGSLYGGTGGASQSLLRSYIFTFALAANTWTKVVITIPGDTAGTWLPTGGPSQNGLELRFDLGCGSSYRTGTVGSWIGGNYIGANGTAVLVATAGASLYVANMQLELGATATPFDWRSSADTLTACQRYYETGNNLVFCSNITSGFIYYSSTRFRVQKRTQPTMTFIDGSNGGFPAGPVTLNTLTTDAVLVQKTCNVTGQGLYVWGFTASAEL